MGNRIAKHAWIWVGKFVKIILEHGVKPNVYEFNQERIHYAAKYGNYEARPN
jgi:hypothetical protein